MLNPRTTHKQLRLEVEANLLPNKDENEDSTDLAPWGFVFRINAFPDSPGFHSHITGRAFTPPAVNDIHSLCCPAKVSKAGLRALEEVARRSGIRVFSVDDHPLIRRGIVAVINRRTDMRVVARITLTDLRLSLNSPKELLLAQLCRQLSASNSGLAADGKGPTISP
jgi:hypothetical protein